ncbi:class I SAM-dependent methyltransferase [bacterium (Candidatus Blackallbacteria) CG17_big_fil_post_rev_8_21_14_2_50_48_46]|uniref:Class I SAM-dependent methyltransferase n=1 Tax=bacterium (Candidatus Blackallbacteria) CG17_big_fil_post_rev_8_21_14_2_50_48_46 TaxID=2014261 RepID=A0A2M7G5X5_9BACT|nr:MAG: SAM-dependent methyltransferase [bacterium (Candidatus Blackallbacteria) CG18_big_fil_WC_8_21_14_2_50_49_26]PIW17450.1 MAG: class I SAM-dependent methyltransferase [bacterium (Candidatus Blackallbacteria) CG17_big_fil_post_rev_8_21_14_2_50_48_46]PIW48304.1 MAG: class I SAM-dependent methyltransferase [bacterium (Candidatus Blackallbacteria) CG13_big_fil_rev_8_21_14_2_50_49_14]
MPEFNQLEFERLNQIADDYDLSPFDTRMRQYMLRTLKPWLKPGKALEMGCMHGEFTSLLAALYPDLTVVEAAAQFIEATRQRVGKAVVFKQSLFETFESEERYDAIFLLHVLEHLDHPVAVLEKAKSLLSPTGRLFLIVPNGNAPSRQIAVKMGILRHLCDLSEADLKHGHRRVYLSDTFENDAREAGLKILARGGIFYKPLANFQFDRLIGTDLISDAFMEACFALGMEHPTQCASIFLVCEAP